MMAPLVLDPLPVETPRAMFDISRLLRRCCDRFGTGVDRIDLAIGLDLAARFGDGCLFVHAAALGPALLDPAFGVCLLEAVSARWTEGSPAPMPATLPALARGTLRRIDPREADTITYVVASHSGLARRRGFLARLDPAGRMPRIVYVHDLFPIDMPEYHKPATHAAFRRFLAEYAQGPVRFVTNSSDTAERLAAYAAREGWPPRRIDVRIPRLASAGHLNAPLRAAVRGIIADPEPFFLCVGTIEPRKNQLLLLHLWRALAAVGRAPRLVLAGRRGWENEMIVDMLERSPSVRAHVVEFGDLTDAEVGALLRGARALLMPSFAEGLGVPLLEATAAGTPAIVSDLPALREIAPAGTVFLDPLDGPAWRRAILHAAG